MAVFRNDLVVHVETEFHVAVIALKPNVAGVIGHATHALPTGGTPPKNSKRITLNTEGRACLPGIDHLVARPSFEDKPRLGDAVTEDDAALLKTAVATPGATTTEFSTDALTPRSPRDPDAVRLLALATEDEKTMLTEGGDILVAE